MQVGSTPQRGKGFFSQGQLSVQTLAVFAQHALHVHLWFESTHGVKYPKCWQPYHCLNTQKYCICCHERVWRCCCCCCSITQPEFPANIKQSLCIFIDWAQFTEIAASVLSWVRHNYYSRHNTTPKRQTFSCSPSLKKIVATDRLSFFVFCLCVGSFFFTFKYIFYLYFAVILPFVVSAKTMNIAVITRTKSKELSLDHWEITRCTHCGLYVYVNQTYVRVSQCF